MDYSFYGGRRGYSFELVKSYSSIDEMITDFADADCTVQYGQFVIIKPTTVIGGVTVLDNNNEDNGKIFKRIYDGYEEIANIKGPTGPVPSVSFHDMTEGESTSAVDLYLRTPTEGGDNVAQISSEIIRDTDNDTWENKIGLKFFKHVFSFVTNQKTWFQWRDSLADQKVEAVELEGSSDDFYHKYSMPVLAGKPGNFIHNLQIMTVQDAADDIGVDSIYIFNSDGDSFSLITDTSYDNLFKKTDEVYDNKNILIFIYDYRDYNGAESEDSPIQKYVCLGRVPLFSTQLVDGQLKLGYKDDEGNFLASSESITLPRKITIDSDGNLSYSLEDATNSTQEVTIGQLKYPTSLKATENNGFEVQYSTGDKETIWTFPSVYDSAYDAIIELGDSDIVTVVPPNFENYGEDSLWTYAKSNIHSSDDTETGYAIKAMRQILINRGIDSAYTTALVGEENDNKFVFVRASTDATGSATIWQYAGEISKQSNYVKNNLFIANAEPEDDESIADALPVGGMWFNSAEMSTSTELLDFGSESSSITAPDYLDDASATYYRGVVGTTQLNSFLGTTLDNSLNDGTTIFCGDLSVNDNLKDLINYTPEESDDTTEDGSGEEEE